MAAPSPEVIEIGSDEHARAGGVLGRAFHDDVQWTALVPDSDARRKRLPLMFSGSVELTLAAGGVAERTSGFEACALWLRPGRDIGVWTMIKSGVASAGWILARPLQNPRPMWQVFRHLDRRRKQLMPDPHWYLMAIGVEPEHQGEGRGSALVRAGMRRADRDRVPIYLETETPNVGFYRSLGFEVIDELHVDEIGVVFSLMARAPQRETA